MTDISRVFTFGFDPFTPGGLALLWLAMFAIIAGRYFIVAGFFYAWFWVFRTEHEAWRRIWPTRPSARMLRTEIGWSVVTSGVFALSGVVLGIASVRGWLPVYLELDRYGWWYLPFSLFLLMFLHDTYFYFTHRAMHGSDWAMKHMHAVHHYSVNPSPWAGFSFHPLEGLAQALIIPVLLLVVPTHPLVLLAFLVVMTVTGITNHLGYELWWRGFARNPVTRYWINATHHSLHHKYYRCNYGLYFTFWDRWLGTEQAGYPELYDQIQSRAPRAA
jgi:Delta7-sterol 5-desaturase